LQIAPVRLDLVEEAPGPLALRRQQAAPVVEAASGPSGDGAQDVQIGEQRLGRGSLRSHGRTRGVVGDAEHEQRVGQHQLARGVGPREVDLIESPDLPGAEAMRRDRLGEAEALGRVGARHRHEVLHRRVWD